MSEKTQLIEEKESPRRLIVPSLGISYFAVKLPTILAGLLLIDIAQTFDRTVSVMAQILTAASLVGALSSVLMGALSAQYDHKTLLLAGLLLTSISSFGSSVAVSFSMLMFIYLIYGLGLAMVSPMAFALVGTLPLKKQVQGVGWVLTGASLGNIIGAPIIGFIAGLRGWRWPFLGFILPVSLLSLVLAAKGLPQTPQIHQPTMGHRKYFEGFRRIFASRPATACLMGSVLTMTGWQALAFFGSSLFRERFKVSVEFAAILLLGSSLCFILGNQVSGRCVNRLGKNKVTVLMTSITSIFIISFTNVNILGAAIILRFIGTFFAGILFTVAGSLTLEQVPSYRGSMMSMHSAALRAGEAFGAGIGGLALLWFDYNGLGLALGLLMITAAGIYYYFVKEEADPDRSVISKS